MGKVPNDMLGHNRLKLDRIAFYGRTLGEYLLMFGINDIRSLIRYNAILDCPCGASSFVAEANSKHGIQAIGCDHLFAKDVETLSKRGEDDIEYIIQRVSTDPNLYNWDFYSSIDKLREYRRLALQQFLLDYPTGIKENRYIKAELPKLPFEDKSFDLVLSGHFLFTYSHKLDFLFILSSILELYRVSSKEVRIYPLQQSSLQPYEQMTEILFALEKLRIGYDIVPVPFEFQRGSNKMLLLRSIDRS
jgi:hypothetical protein